MAGLRMSEAQWTELRREYETGASAKELAARYPVAVSTIYSRASSQRWRDMAGLSDAREVK